MNLKSELKQYHELSKPFLYDVDTDNPLFEKLKEKEEEILRRFGLPCTFSFIDKLQVFGLQDECNDADIEGMIRYLKKSAIDFLHSKPLTDKELLDYGYRHLSTPSDILPLMGLNGNVYQHFVWEAIWLKQLSDAETVLDELRKADDMRFEAEYEEKDNSFTMLKAASGDDGLRWKDEWFLSEQTTINDRIKLKELGSWEYDYEMEYPDVIISKEIYLDRIIVYPQDNTVLLIAFVGWNDRFCPLQIYCDRQKFLSLIAAAPNCSVAELVRLHYFAVINHDLYASTDIHLSKTHDTLLHCNAQVILGSLSDEDDEEDSELTEPFVYYLHEIATK